MNEARHGPLRSHQIAVAILCAMLFSVSPARSQYHTYSEIGPELLAAEQNYPDICKRYDLGLSVQGRHIWALRISDNLPAEEDEPEFKYISTMHGNEPVGTEMCLYLINHLTGEYGSDPQATTLVDEIDSWIVPLMNPDGHVAGSRYNAHGVDLNRDFPDVYTSPDNTPAGRQPETAVIMNWSFGQSFTCSANFHTGALVTNYPFDNNEYGWDVYTATPDDDLFRWISEEYSQHNLPMWNSSTFYHGITNGAEWYVIYGGMQDWSYRYMGCNEVTIELSRTFQPPASQLPQLWEDNRQSMLSYMATCLIGVRGIVSDAITADPLAATITVAGRDHAVYTDPDTGDYHRMLLAGAYDLTFTADGHDPLTVTNVAVSSGDATRLDVALWPIILTFPNGGETLPVDVETLITWMGNPEARFQVQYTQDAGSGTWTDIIALTEPGAFSTPWTPASEGPDYKVRVRSYEEIAGYGLWDESDATFTVGGPVPAVSDWGLVVMVLLVCAAGTIVLRWRRPRMAATCVSRSDYADSRKGGPS